LACWQASGMVKAQNNSSWAAVLPPVRHIQLHPYMAVLQHLYCLQETRPARHPPPRRMDLEVVKRSGTEHERRMVARLQPVIAHPHYLLATLLLTNAVALEMLPIFLDRLLNPVAAILISVTAILLFGEIVPQAVRAGLCGQASPATAGRLGGEIVRGGGCVPVSSAGVPPAAGGCFGLAGGRAPAPALLEVMMLLPRCQRVSVWGERGSVGSSRAGARPAGRSEAHAGMPAPKLHTCRS
jgi:hypothetical protein